nr:hypothetical protein [Actinoplanes auranticolor]
MPFEFTEDGRRGIAGEAVPPLGVVAVGGLDQGQRGDLDQVVERLAAVLIARRQAARQGQVPPHHLFTQAAALGGRAVRVAHEADDLDALPVSLIGVGTARVHARRGRDGAGMQH